jgi:hypothetical protein
VKSNLVMVAAAEPKAEPGLASMLDTISPTLKAGLSDRLHIVVSSSLSKRRSTDTPHPVNAPGSSVANVSAALDLCTRKEERCTQPKKTVTSPSAPS